MNKETSFHDIRVFGGDPLLQKKSRSVAREDDVFQLIVRMRETMTAYDGIGIAASQIGEQLRLFLIAKDLFPPEIQKKLRSDAFINPRLVKKSFKRVIGEEGCLSVPKVFGGVRRSARVTVEAYDHQWKKFRVSADGLLARVLQHELDHLDGTLFVFRADPETLREVLSDGETRPWQPQSKVLKRRL